MNLIRWALRKLSNLIPGVLRKPVPPQTDEDRDRLLLALWAFARIILIACVVTTVTVPAVTWYVIVQRDQARDREAQALDREKQVQIDGQYLNCLRGNEIRAALIASEKEPPQVVDLTGLSSVQNAPEWFQGWAAEVKALSEAAAAAPIDPNSRTGRRIALYESQVRDCPGEYPEHTPGIRLPHDQTAGVPAP